MALQVLHEFQRDLIKLKGEAAYGHKTDPLILSKILQLNSFSKIICRLIPLQRRSGNIEAIICTKDENGIEYLDSESFREKDFDLEYPEYPTVPEKFAVDATRRSIYPAKDGHTTSQCADQVTSDETDNELLSPTESPKSYDSKTLDSESKVQESDENDSNELTADKTLDKCLDNNESDVQLSSYESEIANNKGNQRNVESSDSPNKSVVNGNFATDRTSNSTFTVDEPDIDTEVKEENIIPEETEGDTRMNEIYPKNIGVNEVENTHEDTEPETNITSTNNMEDDVFGASMEKLTDVTNLGDNEISTSTESVPETPHLDDTNMLVNNSSTVIPSPHSDDTCKNKEHEKTDGAQNKTSTNTSDNVINNEENPEDHDLGRIKPKDIHENKRQKGQKKENPPKRVGIKKGTLLERKDPENKPVDDFDSTKGKPKKTKTKAQSFADVDAEKENIQNTDDNSEILNQSETLVKNEKPKSKRGRKPKNKPAEKDHIENEDENVQIVNQSARDETLVQNEKAKSKRGRKPKTKPTEKSSKEQAVNAKKRELDAELEDEKLNKQSKVPTNKRRKRASNVVMDTVGELEESAIKSQESVLDDGENVSKTKSKRSKTRPSKKVLDKITKENQIEEKLQENEANTTEDATEAKPTRSRRAAAQAATAKISETAYSDITPKPKKRGRPRKK